uniref:Uncharacterized protein n=1 Tax=Oncorhynchus tshawytscha TaxID=74940 RepID=A0AAZ3SFN9_ONCTS
HLWPAGGHFGLQRHRGGGQPNLTVYCPASPTSPPMSVLGSGVQGRQRHTSPTQEDWSLMEEGASLERDHKVERSLQRKMSSS